MPLRQDDISLEARRQPPAASNLDEQLKARLRVRAAQHGRSMEDEARAILRSALSTEPVRVPTLVEAIRSRIAPLGEIDLDLPHREAIREPQELGK
ncbi:FitA-like ribbon-helix-helix domain-containing protein [Cupriavidus sp. 8B]